MFETADWIDGPRHLAFRHHSFGCFDAEEHFGTTIPLSDGRQFPTRVLIERHIRRVLGRIPTAADWLRHIKGQPWMVKARPVANTTAPMPIPQPSRTSEHS
jgi:hypothetical protein